MGRLPLIACALAGVLLGVVNLWTRPALSDGGSATAELPGELFQGTPYHGGFAELRRSGGAMRWRVDSPPTANCGPGTWHIGANWIARDGIPLRRDGWFDDVGRMRRLKIIDGRERKADIWARIRGRIDGDRATGTFERTDTVLDERGQMLFRCTRRTGFALPLADSR